MVHSHVMDLFRESLWSVQVMFISIKLGCADVRSRGERADLIVAMFVIFN